MNSEAESQYTKNNESLSVERFKCPLINTYEFCVSISNLSVVKVPHSWKQLFHKFETAERDTMPVVVLVCILECEQRMNVLRRFRIQMMRA